MAQSLGRGITLLFHDHGTRRGWMVRSTPRPHFTPGKDPVPILQEAEGPQGRSGRAENLVPTGIRSRTVQLVVSPVAIPTELPGPRYGMFYMRKLQCYILKFYFFFLFLYQRFIHYILYSLVKKFKYVILRHLVRPFIVFSACSTLHNCIYHRLPEMNPRVRNM